MKKSNLFKSILISVVAFSLPLQVLAYDFKVNGLCYNKNSDGTSVTVTYQNTSSPRYSSLSENLNIPQSVTYSGKTYSVTSIGEDAFDGCTNLIYECENGACYLGNEGNKYHALIKAEPKGLSSVTVKNGTVLIADNAFKEKKVRGE